MLDAKERFTVLANDYATVAQFIVGRTRVSGAA